MGPGVEDGVIKRWANDVGMILLALVLAIVVWIVAIREEDPLQSGEFQDVIPIEVRNQPEGTTFLPEQFQESADHRTLSGQRAGTSTERDIAYCACPCARLRFSSVGVRNADGRG